MITVPSSEHMEALGAALAARLRAGDVVSLSGPLGAGKTTLTRGLAEGMGVRDPVSSPTFVIARRHHNPTGPDLVHCDAYRLGSAQELEDLDLDADGAVVIVEWGDDRVEALSSQWLAVGIERGAGTQDEGVRQVTLQGHGPRWDAAVGWELDLARRIGADSGRTR